MKAFFLSLCLLFYSGLVAKAQLADSNLGIIPAPASVELLKGEFFLAKVRSLSIIYENDADGKIALMLHDFLNLHYGVDLPVTKMGNRESGRYIFFSSKHYKGTVKEGYTLSVSPTHINISGADQGLFYGLQTLIQLFPLHAKSEIKIPCCEINDEPRYKYRGVMLGVGYHIFPVKFIKEVIDLMAEYKLNTLHWHLTEDNGWRIEIKKYPLLTKIGAWREETQVGHNSEEFDGIPYGGYYTQEEIKDIVAYASKKYITIIPEIEMPGHSLAALASYPWLGCGGSYQVATGWNVYKDIYCPTDSTFHFLEDVLTEVMELFPSHYIHIGGDEVPKDAWKKSAFCQQLMRENGLKNEEELQSYFIRRIEKFVNSKGREIIGWDEILEGGLAPNATVESWRGTEGGIEAARQGHHVIMAPTDYVYFDYFQGKAEEEPIAIGGYNPLERVYSYDPTPSELNTDQQKHIVGVEACIWTEFMSTYAKVEYMLLPRMLALAEIAWSPPGRKNYSNFSTLRLPAHLAKLDTSSIIYRVPPAIGIEDTTLFGCNFVIDLKPSVSSASIFYTIDGFDPNETTTIYNKPIVIKIPKGQSRTLKTIVITPSGKRSRITTTVLDNRLSTKSQ